MNESGAIDTKRLQMVLDEMQTWELEVFQREYADLNWYKGKQDKVVKEMEAARMRNKLSAWASNGDTEALLTLLTVTQF